jgi:hypothetical protein
MKKHKKNPCEHFLTDDEMDMLEKFLSEELALVFEPGKGLNIVPNKNPIPGYIICRYKKGGKL